MIATATYRIVKMNPEHDERERNSRCEGHDRQPHRASFVYIFGGRVLCLFCYLNALEDAGKEPGEMI